MPPPQHRVIKPCPVIVPVQTKIILYFLAVVPVFACAGACAKLADFHTKRVEAFLLYYFGQAVGALFNYNSNISDPDSYREVC